MKSIILFFNLKSLIKISVLFVIFVMASFLTPEITRAANPNTCSYEGQCIDNQKCHNLISGGTTWVFSGLCGSAIIGKVRAPAGIAEYNLETYRKGGGDIGILTFASNVIKIFTALGGLFVFINLIIAGFTYIAQAGNPQASSGIKDRLTYSLVGLVIMVSAYTLIAIFSYLIFGNPVFVLNPDLAALGAL